MSDSMLLLAADDVRHGGNAVREGGEAMQSAASNLDYSLRMHQQFLDDWLVRFSDQVDRIVAAMQKEDKGDKEIKA